MASVTKCLGIMAAGSFIGSTGASYFMQSKMNKTLLGETEKMAKNGKIPIGGMTKDGKLWDGAITVEEFRKNLKKQAQISSLLKGAAVAVFTTLVSGLALLMKAKLK